jgi:hypothetical protein
LGAGLYRAAGTLAPIFLNGTTIMLTTDFHIDHDYQPVAICPNCGSLECEDNRIDDRLYIEAAREAEQLRYDGKIDEAVERALCDQHCQLPAAALALPRLRGDIRCLSGSSKPLGRWRVKSAQRSLILKPN